MNIHWLLTGLLLFSGYSISENFYPFNHRNASNKIESATGDLKKQSIENIISHSQDDELVRLSGEFIKKLKCSVYLFRDDTGEIRVRIENDTIPEKGLLFGTPTTIKGEVIKESNKILTIEAEKIRYYF